MGLIIGKQMAAMRARHHFTQDDLAERIGVSSNTISAWETDKMQPSLEHLLMLALLYRCSLDDLVHTKEEGKLPFTRLFVPFRHLRTDVLGYYPETYVDCVEDLENGLYSAWVWTTYYPYKYCVYAAPVKGITSEDFSVLVQAKADSFFDQFYKELEKLVPGKELSSVYTEVCTIAAAEETADTPYHMLSSDGEEARD